MRVILQPLLAAHGNSVIVDTNPGAVLSSLISSYCSQKNIHFEKDFKIYDELRQQLPLNITICSLGITDGQALLIGRSETSNRCRKKWPILVSFLILFIGLIGILTVSLLYELIGGHYFDDYGVVMDAGSSKTNSIVFKWRSNKYQGTGCVSQEDECYSKGGIAKMDPLKLDPVIDCVKSITSSISEENIPTTPLYFAATAGMRLLNLTDSSRASEILHQLKIHLPESGLAVKAVEIISGSDEGIYSWTAVNFLLKTLEIQQKVDPWEPTTYGALDMGGASMQLSFALPPKFGRNSSEYINDLQLYGQTFHVYAQSNLCFGRDEAQNRFEALLLMDKMDEGTQIKNPCAPLGYSKNLTTEEIFKSICARPKDLSKFSNRTYTYVGTSDSNACSVKVSEMLENDVCQKFELDECFKRFEIQLLHQKYVASSTFFYVTDFLNVTNSTLEGYEESMNRFCSYNVTKVEEISNNPFRLKHCFSAHYVFTILLKGLGFTSETWKNIEFLNQISGNAVEWPLGYMINATNIIPEKLSPKLLSTSDLIISLTVFIIVILIVSIFLITRCQKKQNNNSAV